MTWNQDSQKPCAATYTSTLNAFAKKWDQWTMSGSTIYIIVWRHNARSCFESTNLLLLVVPVSWKAAISVCDWRSSTIRVVALVDANMKVKSESHSLIWFYGRTRPSVVVEPRLRMAQASIWVPQMVVSWNRATPSSHPFFTGNSRILNWRYCII